MTSWGGGVQAHPQREKMPKNTNLGSNHVQKGAGERIPAKDTQRKLTNVTGRTGGPGVRKDKSRGISQKAVVKSDECQTTRSGKVSNRQLGGRRDASVTEQVHSLRAVCWEERTH